MKVVKFGGSSLASGSSVEQALNIILSDPQRQVIVVSAPGKRESGDIKVTDLLIKYAKNFLKKESNCWSDIPLKNNLYLAVFVFVGSKASKVA